MIKPVLRYPDPRLKELSKDACVEEIPDLIQDLIDTLKHSNGYGLSAPQIGVLKRVIVVNVVESASASPVPHIMVNPIITELGPEESDLEGCLSFPGIYEKVKRPSYVVVTYIDKDNKDRQSMFHKMEARCVLHEIDHLNGNLFIEKLSSTKRLLVSNKLKRLRK